MNGFKGTPGPWRQVSGDMDGAKVFGIAGANQLSGLGPVVCAVTLASNVNDEDVANAQLIAAAPDLLEALEDLMTGIVDLYSAIANGDRGSGLRFAETDPKYITARSAIARAIGDA